MRVLGAQGALKQEEVSMNSDSEVPLFVCQEALQCGDS